MSHLDRTGEPIDDTEPADYEPPCICDGSKPGFADYDGDHPRPCPRHKPNLIQRRLYGAGDPGPTPGHQSRRENPPATPSGARNGSREDVVVAEPGEAT